MIGFSLLDRYPPEDGETWRQILDARLKGHGDFTAPETIMGRVYWPLLKPLPAGQSQVIGQLGQSLDSRVATVTGQSRDVNGAIAFIHLHRLRALCDAVLVGAGTAVADNPRLTVRLVEGPSPARVVIDPRGRVPADIVCLKDDGVRRLVIRAEGLGGPAPKGVETIEVPCGPDGALEPGTIRDALAAQGLQRLLVEGGANTVARFLQAGALDRLHVMVAPIIIGSGLSAFDLPPISTLSEALRPEVTAYSLGEGEVLYDCALTADGAAESQAGR